MLPLSIHHFSYWSIPLNRKRKFQEAVNFHWLFLNVQQKHKKVRIPFWHLLWPLKLLESKQNTVFYIPQQSIFQEELHNWTIQLPQTKIIFYLKQPLDQMVVRKSHCTLWMVNPESLYEEFTILPTLLFSTLYSIVIIFLYHRSHFKEAVT